MKNWICQGNQLTLTAPYALTSGQGALIGAALFGVAAADIANGASGPFHLVGCFALTKKAGDTPAQGAKLYWDNTNKYVTTTATSNTYIGAAIAAALSADATVSVRLNGAI